MDLLGFELSEAQAALLCDAYCDRGNHREFNYIDFCASCDEKSEGVDLAMSQIQSTYEPPMASKYFTAQGQIIPLSA